MRITTFLIFIITFFVNNSPALAQRAKVGCVDKSIRLQSEQLKEGLKAQGMEVYKDAMISMTNMEPYPIAVQLNQGVTYQLLFVGNNNANKVFFELYDGNDNKIGEKNLDNKDNSNFIVYSFMPQKTDMYLIVVTQKVKGRKEFCGSFSIMQSQTK